MYDSAKYLIHADVRASGVVERSDVVGAIFGQTEGLLGEDLDLRDLQESSKVGRIDVEIDAEGGRSFGTATIASGLDKAETAVLAAGLETIDRVGPCQAEFEVTDLEDARAAKRREVVDRATELLVDFEESSLSSDELVTEVRQNVRVADITEYEGLPAGPRVFDSDAIIVVEGRADVLTLLQYGVKNAVAVEGTDIPDAVADLTHHRTVTTFLDGDRGGDLILKELAQVGDVDYVAFAPAESSVEDLSRGEVLSALRKKVPSDQLTDAASAHEQVTGGPSESSPGSGTDTRPETGAVEGDDCVSPVPGTDGGAKAQPSDASATADQQTPASSRGSSPADAGVTPTDGPETDAAETASEPAESDVPGPDESATDTEEAASVPEEPAASPDESDSGTAETVAGHVEAIVGAETGQARLLDETAEQIEEVPAEGVFAAIEAAEAVPTTVVLDGTLTQRVLDVAAQRGVDQIITRAEGEFVKQPTNVRIRTAAEA
jgi:DNA primase